MAVSAELDALAPEERARVLVLDHIESLGRWAAANAGVRVSTGEYLVLHDDDDLWHPEFLATMVGHLDSHLRDVAVASRTEIVFERRHQDGRIERIGSELFCPDIDSITLPDMLRRNQIVPIVLVYRRTLHDEIGFYNQALAVVGDWEFNLRILAHHRIAFLPEHALAYWCQRLEESSEYGNSVRGSTHFIRSWIRSRPVSNHSNG